MDTEQLLYQRHQKDHFFKTDKNSPLNPQQRAKFEGLRYYPPNSDLALTLTINEFATKDMIEMQTSSGAVRKMRRFGTFSFVVDGQTVNLTMYEMDYSFFLPFVDANAKTETYPAGRYLEPEDIGDGQFVVDFNQAYNPYCAYGDRWSCPITPLENRLNVAIRAGEMLPDGEWLEAH
jgi:uncharacterized protein